MKAEYTRILEDLREDTTQIINEGSENYFIISDIPHCAKLNQFFVDPIIIEMFEDFMHEWSKARDDIYKKNYPSLEVKPLKFTVGKKFIKIVANGGVMAFVDNCGNVYKPAGWAKPANGVRYYLSDAFKIKFDAHGSFLYGNSNLTPKTEADF